MEYSSKIYLKLITKHDNYHNACNDIIAAFIFNFKDGTKQYLNFEHNDLPIDCTFKEFKSEIESQNLIVYVNNKKTYKYWLNCNLIDVNLFGFINNNEILDEVECLTENFLKYNYRNINNFNLILPYVIHQRIFDVEIKQIETLGDKDTDNYCFKFFNNVISDTLFEVEKNGLKVDTEIFSKYFKSKTYNKFIYTNYNIYNPTGRPSNAYDNINYVALKKDDGSRASFVSRYGESGHLMMVDFTGFHPYIVANLIDYKVPEKETIYEHLAKYYFDVDTVTSEDIAKSKKLTMVNLYGQISQQYCNIPYFAKVNELKDKYWQKFEKNGYITTPVYKRKITNKHIIDPNRNKLFSYIIQAAETEYGIDSLSKCIKFVSDKRIVPILYVYDSIVFDVHNDTNKQELIDLVDIIKNKRFKVKTYIGNNYNDLKLVQM